MIILKDNTTSLQVVLSGAVTINELQWSASWRGVATSFPSGNGIIDDAGYCNNGETDGTTAVDLVNAPDSNTNTVHYCRHIEYVSVYNYDSATAIVIVQIGIVGGSNVILQKITLPSGYSLIYSAGSGWNVYSTTGQVVGTTTTVLPDGDYGDITISSGGTVLTIDNDVVNNAKLANMANFTIKGRHTAGTGDPEDLTAAQVRTILDLASLYQPLDSDLTDIAALSPSNDDIIQRKAGVWTNRTIAQYYADLQASVKDDSYFNLTFGFGNLSPVDATTYYYTQLSMTGAGASTTQANRETTVPYDCTLIGAAIEVLVVTLPGSNENVPVVLRVNNTTDLTVKTDVKFDATHNKYSVSGLSGNLTAGDSIQGKSVMPSFVTNPLSVYLVCTLYFKRR